jgi:hypothetical protein
MNVGPTRLKARGAARVAATNTCSRIGRSRDKLAERRPKPHNKVMEKRSLFDVQLSFVICGGASRSFFTEAAPKAHPKMTNDN